MISCFSEYGTGAALAISVRIDERSARASSPGGRVTMRFSWVGAENVLVTRCSFTRRSHAAGSNLRSTTIGAAERVREQRERQRARVVQRTGREVHRRAVEQVHGLHERGDRDGVGAGAHRALGLPGGARRVDHRGAGGARARVVGHLGRRGGLRARPRRPSATHPSGASPPNTSTARTFGQLVAHRRDQRRLLGVDDHERGVGVVDDVLHLVRVEPVRQRHRREADLAAGVERR